MLYVVKYFIILEYVIYCEKVEMIDYSDCMHSEHLLYKRMAKLRK